MTQTALLVVQTGLGILVGVLFAAVYSRRDRPSRTLQLGLLVAMGLAILPMTLWKPVSNQPPGRVRVVSVLDEETTDALTAAFTADTGIVCEVDPFAGGAKSTVDLILGGRIHPDVFLGGTAEIHEELALAGRVSPYQVAPDAGRVDRFDDPQGRWTPLYLGYLAIIYRPLPTLQTHQPDWLTLIQPRWRGRVAIPNPHKAGGGLVFMALQILRQPNESKGWEYLGLLRENGARLEDRSVLPITRVAAGTMDLGVAWAHDALRRIERERLPIELVIPDPTGYEVGCVSILSDARDIEAARKLVDFLAGRDSGQLQIDHGYRVALRSDIEPPPYLAEGRALEPGDAFDREAVRREKEAWLESWRATWQLNP